MRSAGKANSRTQSEVVKEFVELERIRIQKNEHANLERALLEEISLVGADDRLPGIDFRGAVSGSRYHNPVQLSGATLVGADFEGVDLTGIAFATSDLRRARLNSTNVEGVLFLQTDLRDAQLFNIKEWTRLESVRGANIHEIRHALDELREWALTNGAVEISSDKEWHRFRDRFTPFVNYERFIDLPQRVSL